ncbi:ferric reductase like transmembrane component-domain-containing protein [Aspergillus carlsbadensis]|nr:ferric reductase like transmembrane component-domain-containing protein [Aspergillus carlsbadensis]
MAFVALVCVSFLTVGVAAGGHHHEDLHHHDDVAWYTLLVLGGLAVLIFMGTIYFRLMRHIRRILCLNDKHQSYFARPHNLLARFKVHLLDAPLFSRRHNTELQLSRAVNFRTIPTRLQALLIFALLGMNVVLCVVAIPFDPSEKDKLAGRMRHRFGVMAVANLVSLVLCSGRNNPLIPLLGVPYDTFNLLHRWLGRIVVLEALAHMLAYCISKAEKVGWDGVGIAIRESTFLLNGLVAICLFAVLLLHSPSPIRHAFYETFAHLHFAVAAVSFAFLWMHLRGRHAQSYLLAAIILWAVERTVRMFRVLYRGWGVMPTTAAVELMPGDAVKVTLKIPRPWTPEPGEHIFICIPSIGWMTFHPFSVCWIDGPSKEVEIGVDEIENNRIRLPRKAEIVTLLVRRRTGFTDRLFQRAQRARDCQLTMGACVDGPYGGGMGTNTMESYGTVLLFAAGIGITHQMSFIRHLVHGYASGIAVVRRLVLVWVVRTPEHLDWVREWMEMIFEMEGCAEMLRIQLFITLPCDVKEIRWLEDVPAEAVDIRGGRPDADKIVSKEACRQIGAVGVLVCGTGSFSDDVRAACRKVQGRSQVDYIEESFSW